MEQKEINDVGSGNKHVKCKFTQEEDDKLLSLVQQHGYNWQKISSEMGNRNIRQCKERYENYLSPNVNRSQFTEEEDRLLLEKYRILGPRWVSIAKLFNGRTDSAIKSRFLLLKRRGIIAEYLERGYLETANMLLRDAEPNERRVKKRQDDTETEPKKVEERADGQKKCRPTGKVLVEDVDVPLEVFDIEFELQPFSFQM